MEILNFCDALRQIDFTVMFAALRTAPAVTAEPFDDFFVIDHHVTSVVADGAEFIVSSFFNFQIAFIGAHAMHAWAEGIETVCDVVTETGAFEFRIRQEFLVMLDGDGRFVAGFAKNFEKNAAGAGPVGRRRRLRLRGRNVESLDVILQFRNALMNIRRLFFFR